MSLFLSGCFAKLTLLGLNVLINLFLLNCQIASMCATNPPHTYRAKQRQAEGQQLES
jgi:hypothetical protein